MTDMSLPLTQNEHAPQHTSWLSHLSYAFDFRVPNQQLQRAAYFKVKFFYALLLSSLFWVFELTRYFFWQQTGTTATVQYIWIGVASLQMLTLGLPLLAYVIKSWRTQFSKLPAVMAAYLSFTLVISMLLIKQNLSYLPFVEITSYILLILSYVFYVDQKNANDIASPNSDLQALLVPQARLWLAENNSKTVPTAEIKPGDKILIYAGEAIARDGIIVNGMTSVDESAITLEKKSLCTKPKATLCLQAPSIATAIFSSKCGKITIS